MTPILLTPFDLAIAAVLIVLDAMLSLARASSVENAQGVEKLS
jgi:hypothetical protein